VHRGKGERHLRAGVALIRLRCLLGGVEMLPRFRPARRARSSFAAMGILVVLSGSAPRFTTGHCAGHEAPATEMHHLGHHPGAAAIEAPAHEPCHHCPPAQCAAVAPCNNASSEGYFESGYRAVEFPFRLETPLPGLLLGPPSPAYQPPIPPPRSNVWL
jgi:hypothetical protein